eukprot:m.240309 g.240309  ORF g.240309 m.240309 type:complete len:56 (+) comp23296_c0_seq1:288-455(+)
MKFGSPLPLPPLLLDVRTSSYSYFEINERIFYFALWHVLCCWGGESRLFEVSGVV